MKKPGGEWFWVDFRYERLPSFCFHCGVIGHSDRFCPVAFATEVVGKEKPFGPWLRAGGGDEADDGAGEPLVGVESGEGGNIVGEEG